jgi:hypothetical protein
VERTENFVATCLEPILIVVYRSTDCEVGDGPMGACRAAERYYMKRL